MARKSKKAELRKQELISNVPLEQRKMITQPITFAFLNGDMSVMHARIQATIMDKLQGRIAKAVKKQHEQEGGFTGSLFSAEDFKPVKGISGNYLTFSVKYSELGVDPANYRYVSEAARAMQGSLFYEQKQDGYLRSIVVFPVIDVPDETKKERRTDIKLYMAESTARDLFTFKKGNDSENFYDMQYRVMKTLRHILATDDGKNVVIVAHSGVIRALENNLKGLRVDDDWEPLEKGDIRIWDATPMP